MPKLLLGVGVKQTFTVFGAGEGDESENIFLKRPLALDALFEQSTTSSSGETEKDNFLFDR